jgi:hypothetical protein
MVKLSQTTKMPGRSWGLPAGSTCPGSRDASGEVVPVCKACYAKTGNYTYPAARGAREFNRTDWRRDEWVDEMIREVSMDSYFRWFDSGDLYHAELGHKMLAVIKGTPHVRHWIPTRSHTVPRLRAVLELIRLEPNAVVRYSSPSADGAYDAEHGSTVIPFEDWPTSASVCPSSQQEGRCGACRKCWDVSVPVIAYVGHGLVMSHMKKRILKQKAVDAEAA